MSLMQAKLILVIAISLLCINETVAINNGLPFFKFGKFYVAVLNELHASGYMLHVHCKSKDDDLGLHELAVGQQFEWGFRTNYFDSTLFFCTFQWSRGIKTFDVFETEGTFVDRCGGRHCLWKAQEDGIYLFDSKKKLYNLVHMWDKL